MVIEYAGTVIRAVLTDKRQKFYDSKVSNRPKSLTARVCFCIEVDGDEMFAFASGNRLLHVPH